MLTQFCDGNNTLKYELGLYAKRLSEKSGRIDIGTEFDGQIAEVLVYNRCLSDEEVAKTGLALAEKFALNWTLVDEVQTPSDDQNSNPPATEESTDTQELPGGTDSTVAPAGKHPSQLGLIVGLSVAAVAVAVGVVWFVIRKRKK